MAKKKPAATQRVRSKPKGKENVVEAERYSVKLSAPKGHTFPPLLKKFGGWLAKQTYPSVGYFSLRLGRIPDEWDPEAAQRLNRDGYLLLRMPDDSFLALIETGRGSAAVVLLGSEGDSCTVATSLEQFLILLAKGETGVFDLDNDDATGRAALRKWIAQNKIKTPKAMPFDFSIYLDGGTPAEASPKKPATTKPAARLAAVPKADLVAGLSPGVKKLCSLLGHRADDPEIKKFVTKDLGQSLPSTTTGVNKSRHVVAKKRGMELLFTHDVIHDAYPPIPVTKNAFLPYFSLCWLKAPFGDQLPFGFRLNMTRAEVEELWGPPTSRVGSGRWVRDQWTKILDRARDIELSVAEEMDIIDGTKDGSVEVAISVRANVELSSADFHPLETGLFIAWAASRNLLNEETIGASALAALKKRQRQGSDLFRDVLPRGLWDIHLSDRPGLRDFAYDWFNNIAGTFITFDLNKVFGKREGPHGHDEPKLDNDDWKAVERATPMLDKRFAEWVGKGKKMSSKKK